MKHFCYKIDIWPFIWEIIWKMYLYFENSIFISSSRRTFKMDFPIIHISIYKFTFNN